MLSRIYVDNFRCLVNFEFKPARVNLLVGANGSGKSTFLEALRAIRNVVNGESPLQTSLPPGSLAWWDASAAQTFEVDITNPAGGQLFQYRLRIARPPEVGVPMVEEESVVCDGKPLLTFAKKRVTIASEDGSSQSFAFEGGNSPVSAGMGDNKRLALFRTMVAAISFFRLNPWIMDARTSTESGGIMGTGSNFVDWLRGIMVGDPKAFAAWQASLVTALPHITSVRLDDLGGGVRLLKGMMTRPGSPDQPIPFYDFSEGEKCLAVLHLIAATRQRHVVLSLDEPDNFLSLRELQPVLSEIIKPVEGGAGPQIFVVSHHPESIDYLAADSTWIFERPRGAHVRVRPMIFDREKGERASESVKAELQ